MRLIESLFAEPRKKIGKLVHHFGCQRVAVPWPSQHHLSINAGPMYGNFLVLCIDSPF